MVLIAAAVVDPVVVRLPRRRPAREGDVDQRMSDPTGGRRFRHRLCIVAAARRRPASPGRSVPTRAHPQLVAAAAPSIRRRAFVGYPMAACLCRPYRTSFLRAAPGVREPGRRSDPGARSRVRAGRHATWRFVARTEARAPPQASSIRASGPGMPPPCESRHASRRLRPVGLLRVVSAVPQGGDRFDSARHAVA